MPAELIPRVQFGFVSNDAFPINLAQHLRELGDVGAEALHQNSGAQRHQAALDALADLIRSLPLNDPRLVALWTYRQPRGSFGPHQRKLLALLGVDDDQRHEGEPAQLGLEVALAFRIAEPGHLLGRRRKGDPPAPPGRP